MKDIICGIMNQVSREIFDIYCMFGKMIKREEP